MLTEKQKLSIILLRNGEKVITTAQACGVHRCTVWRWYCKRDVMRRYNLYCELDYKRSLRFEDRMAQWRKYEDDLATLLKAIESGNKASIALMQSHLIDEYYSPLEGRIEARMTPQSRKQSR